MGGVRCHAVQTAGSFVLPLSVDSRSNGSPLPAGVPPPPVAVQTTPTGSRTLSYASSHSGASSLHSAAQLPAAGSAVVSPPWGSRQGSHLQQAACS